MGTIHETGHGRYEQNRPRDWLGQPVARGALDGDPREPEPVVRDAARPQPRLRRPARAAARRAPSARSRRSSPTTCIALLTRVEPGLIRVDADELTYPAHVILRYEIERALIEGEIEAEDIPALWDEKMAALLGLDTRGNFTRRPHAGRALDRRACSATSRATRSARCTRRSGSRRCAARTPRSRCAHRRAATSRRCSTGCATNIWLQASRYETDELCAARERRGAEPAHFRRHLEARYLA